MFMIRFTIKCLMGMMIPLSVESFGTLNRTVGVAFCMSIGKVGPFLIPFIIFKIFEIDHSYPFVLFEIISIILLLSLALLPKDKTN